MILKRYYAADLSQEDLQKIYQRPLIDLTSVYEQIKPIIEDVKSFGDKALNTYTAKFDHVIIKEAVVDVPNPDDIILPPSVKKAFDTAFKNIFRFHFAQKPNKIKIETTKGIICERIAKPIERVGLYIPGGTAVLPSTVLMLGVPAKIAGCSKIILSTPPRSDGSISPEVFYCAGLIGADKIIKAGGAQSIAAMAYGTESVPKVDKILGPGNQYVTAAKMYLSISDAKISIDMPAGPSEVLVIADETADADFIAADLLSQAEHGEDSQASLLVTENVDIAAIERAIVRQLKQLSRADIAKKALESSSVIITTTIDEAIEISNEYAPEHLILNIKKPTTYLNKIKHAGSVFIGKWTPESLGDYASGTNHTLPTNGYARMYSGVNLLSYMTFMTVQKASKKGLQKLGPIVETMASVEGLDAHKQAVSIRLKVLANDNRDNTEINS